jgi:hypothetical protein
MMVGVTYMSTTSQKMRCGDILYLLCPGAYGVFVALICTLRDSARQSPPPPQPHPPLVECDDLDLGHSRWSKQHANGPSQMGSRESSRGRAHDVAMDVDDIPLPRSDPPTKQIPPRRPALQDDVPRYPRVMLNSDNDGPPRGISVAPPCSFCD